LQTQDLDARRPGFAGIWGDSGGTPKRQWEEGPDGAYRSGGAKLPQKQINRITKATLILCILVLQPQVRSSLRWPLQ
jgi:hypothetical protein